MVFRGLNPFSGDTWTLSFFFFFRFGFENRVFVFKVLFGLGGVFFSMFGLVSKKLSFLGGVMVFVQHFFLVAGSSLRF